LETFFGRKKEINKLLTAFNQAKKHTRKNILISGYAGEGKTALVNNFALNAESKGAVFVYGKANATHGSTPYSAITQALGMLIKKMIAENPDGIIKIKVLIQKRLAASLNYALTLVPELKYFFEEISDPEEFYAKSGKHHANILLLSLLEIFTGARPPLIFFLDDLQWLDTASYEFLQYIAINDSLKNFMLIMAFRSNINQKNNFFKTTLKRYRDQDNSISIVLKGLTRNEIKRYLKNRFKSSRDLTPLSDACHNKTAGNPFYMTRLVDDLVEKGAIKNNDGDWTYDISFISRLSFSENVADLIIAKLKRLADDSVMVLKHGTCMKEGISIELLMASSGFEAEKIDTLLWKPLQLNFLNKTSDCYHFSHDRILESVETLISEKEKISIHKKLVQFYLAKDHHGVLANDIFTLLHHYSFYQNTITDPETKEKMSRLYFRAGTRAGRQSANDLALSYYISGKEHFPGNIWQKDYDLALNFCNNAARCAYLASDFSTAEKIFQEVDLNVTSVRDSLEIELVKIPCYQATENPRKALGTGLTALQSLGVKLSANPFRLTILYHILKTWLKLILTRSLSRKQKNMAKDSTQYYIVKIIAAMGPSMFFFSPRKILPIALSIGLDYNLKYGCMEDTSSYYILFGMLLNNLTDSIRHGRKLRKSARKISREFSNDELKGKEMFLATVFMDHWDTSMMGTVTAFEAGEAFCLRHEEHDYYAFNAVFCMNCLFISGTCLKTVLDQFLIKKKILTRLDHKYALTLTGVMALGMENLLKGSMRPWIIKEDFFTESLLEPMEKEILFDVHFYKLCIAFFCGRMDTASEIKENLEPYVEAEYGQPTYYYFHFLEALINIYQHQNRKKIKAGLGRLKKYAGYNPLVYKSKYLIAMAEHMRTKGNLRASAKLYDESLQVSEKFNNLFEQAFALEKLGLIEQQRGKDDAAKDCFQKAVNLYKEWGLKWRHNLFDFNPEKNKPFKNIPPGRDNQRIKNHSLVKMIDRDLWLIKKTSGADNIHIAIKMSGKWKSIVNILDNEINQPVTFVELPEKILTFACATEEILIINKENIKTQFFDTFYLEKYRPLSCMVIPEGKTRAVYIENHSENMEMEALTRLSRQIFQKVKTDKTPRPGPSYKDKTAMHRLQECCRELQEYMKDKKAYQNMELNLASLAKETSISQRMITNSINTILNQNFHTFINNYRIEEVKKELREPLNSKKSILDIAFAAGFSSKSTFNDIFKKSVGMTPSKFRKADME